MVGPSPYERATAAGLRTARNAAANFTQSAITYAQTQQGVYPGAFTAQMLGASQTTKGTDYDIGQFSRQLKDLGSDLMGFRDALVNATKGIGVAAVENVAMTKLMIDTAKNSQRNTGGVGAFSARQALMSAVIQGMDRGQLMQSYSTLGTAGILGLEGRSAGQAQTFQGFSTQFAQANRTVGFGPQIDRYNQFASQTALQQQQLGNRNISVAEIMAQAGAIRMAGQNGGGLQQENDAITGASALTGRYATGARSGSPQAMGVAAVSRDEIAGQLANRQKEIDDQIELQLRKLKTIPAGSEQFKSAQQNLDNLKNERTSVSQRLQLNTGPFTPDRQRRAETQSGVIELDAKLRTEVEMYGGKGSLHDKNNEGRNIAVTKIADESAGGDVEAVEAYIAAMKERENFARRQEAKKAALANNPTAFVAGSFRGDKIATFGQQLNETPEERAAREQALDPMGLQKKNNKRRGRGYKGGFESADNLIVYTKDQGEMMQKENEDLFSVTREDTKESFQDYTQAMEKRIQNLNIDDRQKAAMRKVLQNKAKNVDPLTGKGAAKAIEEGQNLFSEYTTYKESKLGTEMIGEVKKLKDDEYKKEYMADYAKGGIIGTTSGLIKQASGGDSGFLHNVVKYGGIGLGIGTLSGTPIGTVIGGLSGASYGALKYAAMNGMLGSTLQGYATEEDTTYDPNKASGPGQNKLEQGQANLVDLNTALMNLTSVLNNNVIPAFRQIPGAGPLVADAGKTYTQVANAATAAGSSGGSSGDGGWGTPGTGRAFGGPVFAGQTTTVGERGQETFIPKQDGYILPAEATKRMVPDSMPRAENGAQVTAGNPVIVGDGIGANSGAEMFVEKNAVETASFQQRKFITQSENFLSGEKGVSPFFGPLLSAKGTTSIFDIVQNAFNKTVQNSEATSHFAGNYAAPSGTQGGVGVPVRNIGLGSVSAQFESSGNYGAVSAGVGDAGGKSYGIFQLSSKMGSLNAFLGSSSYAGHFNGLVPGSPEFDDKWRSLANDPGFAQEQLKYGQEKYYKPALDRLSSMGIDLSRRSQAVQELIMSTAVQYGPANNKLSRVLNGKDVSALSDEQIINLVQASKIENIKGDFTDSSEDVRNGVLNRIERERKTLLSMIPEQKSEDNDSLPGSNVAGPPPVSRKGGGLIFPGQIARVNEGDGGETIMTGTASSVLSKIETERFSENLNSARMNNGKSNAIGGSDERKVVVQINLPNQNMSTQAEINFDDHAEKVKYLTIDPRDQWSNS
ncbi:hypothetical protein EBR57_00015 [bacterium]|nr:hypothetical protein [bacterium]